ncbi:LamG-like jellyroll fold domain-containing protein, partial [Salmonella sp. SAL4438]|uniref:LamG-like jellyroll fold domain-containing protein n=1 Tax=Salmonella sp. SAL4438 TaxID=3159893 RepID=UPI00397C7103
MYKGDDNYYLEGTSAKGGAAPVAGGTFGETWPSSGLAVNTWTHLAVTYNKAVLALYVNGVLASSRSRTGNIATSANPLQIGGDSIY